MPFWGGKPVFPKLKLAQEQILLRNVSSPQGCSTCAEQASLGEWLMAPICGRPGGPGRQSGPPPACPWTKDACPSAGRATERGCSALVTQCVPSQKRRWKEKRILGVQRTLLGVFWFREGTGKPVGIPKREKWHRGSGDNEMTCLSGHWPGLRSPCLAI